MLKIKISKDFTITPGARYYTDGPYSGEEFYEKLLKPKYLEAVQLGVKLLVDLDGTDGYASSFLNEAFSRLGNEFGAEVVSSILLVISDEVPKYLKKVNESIYEKRKS